MWSKKNDPKRCIGALELLALVILLRMAANLKANRLLPVRFAGLTDNQGDAFSILKSYSRKMPAAAVHMELAASAWFFSTLLCVEHTNRENNTWADELTNQRMRNWDPRLRYSPQLDKTFFMCLDSVASQLGTPHARSALMKAKQTTRSPNVD